MRYVLALFGLAVLFYTNTIASDILVFSTEIDGNTVITCHLPAEMGKVDMAFIKFQNTNKTLPDKTCPMEISDSGSNIVTYIVPGTHQELKGNIQIMLEDLSKEIINEDFDINK